jgi:hypothetical protein
MQGPPSITFFLSWGEETLLNMSETNGFLSWKIEALILLLKKSG